MLVQVDEARPRPAPPEERRRAARPDVTVVTVTRGRPELVMRAIRSVRSQSYTSGKVQHLIVVDDCHTTWRALARTPRSVMVAYVARSPDDRSGPVRLARLRNLAVELVSTPWMSWLDDDNEFDPDHVESLFETQRRTGADAVHSHRRMYHHDGAPFTEALWPWARDPRDRVTRYEEYRRLGIVSPGSNVVRDRVEVSAKGASVAVIDTNVWLIRTSLLREHPIPDRFNAEDWERNLAEDDKMLDAIVRAGVRPACTERPTVRYYLGGYSNDFANQNPVTERWERIE